MVGKGPTDGALDGKDRRHGIRVGSGEKEATGGPIDQEVVDRQRSEEQQHPQTEQPGRTGRQAAAATNSLQPAAVRQPVRRGHGFVLRLGHLYLQAAHRAFPRMRGRWPHWIPGHHTPPRPAGRYCFCCRDWGYVCRRRVNPWQLPLRVSGTRTRQAARFMRGELHSAHHSFRAARCTQAFGRAVAPDGAAFYGTAEAVPLTKQGYSAGCERGPFRFGVGVERWRETHLSAQMRARRWGTRRDEDQAAQRGY